MFGANLRQIDAKPRAKRTTSRSGSHLPGEQQPSLAPWNHNASIGVTVSQGEFNVIDGPAGKFISVDSDRLDETMTLFAEQQMAGIHISSMGPYKTTDLEFLRDHPNVTSVLVSEAGGIDLGGLAYLTNLKHLTLDNYDLPISLRQFGQLETFAGQWSKELQLGPECARLTSLSLRKYKAKDLTQFPALPALSSLELVQASLASLEGIQLHSQIEKLTFHRCSKLASIDAIAGLSDGSLRQLSFERCQKIENIEILGRLRRVKTINLQYCPDLRGLDFLQGCQQLEGFGFFGTKLPDGDLTPLLSLPKLSFVGMSDKRHFSHSQDELNRLLLARASGTAE